MVSCATAEDNFELTARIADQSKPDSLDIKYEEMSVILPCFGIHPWFVDSVSPQWEENLEAFLLSCPSGVGETGLDFVDKTADREKQLQIFEHHLILARELERPVNIHIRKAWDAFIHILKRIGPLKTPGLIHSYSGSADMVPLLEKYGLFLSFSGAVTNPGAVKAVAALNSVSKDCYVLETDSPDIQPYFSGKRISGLNEPAYLPAISDIAASRIKADPVDFAQKAYENSITLFKPLLKGFTGFKGTGNGSN